MFFHVYSLKSRAQAFGVPKQRRFPSSGYNPEISLVGGTEGALSKYTLTPMGIHWVEDPSG